MPSIRRGEPPIHLGGPSRPSIDRKEPPEPSEEELIRRNKAFIAAKARAAAKAQQEAESRKALEAESNRRTEAIAGEISGITSKLQQLHVTLDNEVANNTRETFDKLELALHGSSRIAAFIDGDFDVRASNVSQKEDLMREIVVAFGEADDRAALGLSSIGNIHAQVVDIHNVEILVVKTKIDILAQETDTELKSLHAQIDSTTQLVANATEALKHEEAAIRNLESARRKLEPAHRIWDAISFNIGDIAGLDHKVKEAKQNLRNAQEGYRQSSQNLARLTERRGQLEQQLANKQRLQSGPLPQVILDASQIEEKSIAFQSQFAAIKNTAAQLLLKIKSLEARAVLAEATVITKDEFAMALLDICGEILIDRRFADEVRLIIGMVTKGYGVSLPPAIAEREMNVEDRLRILG